MLPEVHRGQVGRWTRPLGRRLFSPTLGRGRLVAPDGSVLWEDPDWVPNALHDEGEASLLNVYLREQANPTKYLMLHDAGPGTPAELADTVTMAGLTESEVPGTDGYARPQMLAADWGAPALDAGDMASQGATKSFGTNTGTEAWNISHVCLVTVSTGTAGLLISSIPLTARASVVQGLGFTYAMKSKAQ